MDVHVRKFFVWNRLFFVLSRLCVHNVTGLSAGKEYQFRIFAENFYGRSEPCEPTAPTQTEQAPEGKLRREGLFVIIIAILRHHFNTSMWQNDH